MRIHEQCVYIEFESLQRAMSIEAQPTTPSKTVIVGTTKPVLNYVTACITLFNGGEQKIVLRARGRAINVAVEVVELLRRRFMKNVTISSAKIEGDRVESKDGRSIRLPVLELVLTK